MHRADTDTAIGRKRVSFRPNVPFAVHAPVENPADMMHGTFRPGQGQQLTPQSPLWWDLLEVYCGVELEPQLFVFGRPSSRPWIFVRIVLRVGFVV